jgi:hypothetical protein
MHTVSLSLLCPASFPSAPPGTSLKVITPEQSCDFPAIHLSKPHSAHREACPEVGSPSGMEARQGARLQWSAGCQECG